MVAGLMNTASIWFGLSLAIYLCVWLYCCLLFHLKLEADAATAALPVPGEKSSPEAFRRINASWRARARVWCGVVVFP